MPRRALLICCPNTPGQTPLPGAQVDFETYDTYLRSRVGGAWTNQEIIPLVDEARQTVLDTVHTCHNMDYVFVLFSGHGSHPPANPNPVASRVRLTGGMLTINQLDPGNGRCTIIVDSCRSPGAFAATTEQYLNENAVIAARATLRPQAAEYREAFNLAITRCPEHTAYLFGCSVGQNAIDDPDHGGLFPQALRSRAIAWERERNSHFNATESVHSMFLSAAWRVSIATKFHQAPRFHRTVDEGFQFPFAVYRAG